MYLDSTRAMKAAIQSVDENTLHALSPLCNFTEAQRREILARSEIFSLRKKTTLFEMGESDERSIYILSGEIALKGTDGTTETIRAATPRALQPLTQKSPHDQSATAITNCTFLSLPSAELAAIQMSIPSRIDATDIDVLSNNDWLKDLLQGPAYGSLLPQQIESLITRVEAVPVKVGQVIIKQGSTANNFYIIRSGKFQITRKIDGVEHPIELAILSSGSGFGEDALITHGRRNAFVTAIEDGELLRLSKHNFTTLLAQSLIRKITLEHAERLVKRGAVFVDVRAADEFKRNGLTEAVHVPLSLLRANLSALKPGRDYIAYCNTGTLSAIACFVLAQNGRRAFILNGGLDGLSANEDHLLSRTTRHNDPPVRGKVFDVQKITRRLTSVATPAPVVAIPVGNHNVNSNTKAQQQDNAVEELAKLKAKLNNLAGNEPSRAVNLPPSAAQSESKLAAAPAPDQVRDDFQLWTQIPEITPQALNELKISSVSASTNDKTNNPGATDQMELSWINDQVLWDSVIGYRSDPRVDALLAAESYRSTVALQPTQNPTPPQRPLDTGSVSPTRSTHPSLGKQRQTRRTNTIGTPKRRSIQWIVISAILGCISLLAISLREFPEWMSLPIQLPPALSALFTPAPNSTADTAKITIPTNTKPVASAVDKHPVKRAVKRTNTPPSPVTLNEPQRAVTQPPVQLDNSQVKTTLDAPTHATESSVSSTPIRPTSNDTEGALINDSLPTPEIKSNEGVIQPSDTPSLDHADTNNHDTSSDTSTSQPELQHPATSSVAPPELTPEQPLGASETTGISEIHEQKSPINNPASSDISMINTESNKLDTPPDTPTTTQADPADLATSPDPLVQSTTM